MSNKELLENYRQQIDTLDKEIIYLLFRRFTIVEEIWKIKKVENIPVLQEKRWKKLLEDNIEKAEEYWLNKKLIEDLWGRIHKESLEIEK
jgi:chorismate mutase